MGKDQRSDPVNLEAIRTIKQSVQIPVVANGDIKNMDNVVDTVAATGVDGVMAARGMLENPAMFAGFDVTPTRCVEDWVRLALTTGTPFSVFSSSFNLHVRKELLESRE